MMDFPFQLPQSLSSYLDLFSIDQDKTVEKLEAHLKKRGHDAVGHFLLSWIYLQINNKPKAIEQALIAKTFAPGSPFLEYLHYFITHPDALNAYLPQTVTRDSKKVKKGISASNFLLDLESIISRLSHVEGHKITIKSIEENIDVDLSEQSISIDDLATETLATIHVAQGNKENAIIIYKKLIEKQPEKKSYFEEKIQALAD